jgi:hypothetical protein
MFCLASLVGFSELWQIFDSLEGVRDGNEGEYEGLGLVLSILNPWPSQENKGKNWEGIIFQLE